MTTKLQAEHNVVLASVQANNILLKWKFQETEARVAKMDKEKADNKLLPNTGNERQPKKIHSAGDKAQMLSRGAQDWRPVFPIPH